MKNILLLFLLVFSLINSTLQAQDSLRISKFKLVAGAELGNAIVVYNEDKIAANSQGGYVLLNYDLNFVDLETGIALVENQGNFLSSEGNSYFNQRYIQIPLGVNTNISVLNNVESLSQLIKLKIAAGIYAANLFKNELHNGESEKNLGWNMGYYTQFGVSVKATDLLKFGLSFKTQDDFGDIETDLSTINNIRNVIALDIQFKL